MERKSDGTFATIFPLRYNHEVPDAGSEAEVLDIGRIKLLEQNRGKAGALNVAREFFLHFTKAFALEKSKIIHFFCKLHLLVTSKERCSA